MKKLDIYIIKKFLGTFFFALLLIIIIVVVFDISEKIDNFIGKDVTLYEIVFDYYLNFIPYFSNLFSALFVFISVIFFTSKLAGDSEIVAILSSGVSFKRLLVPYFIASFILAIFSFVLINWIIPPANVKRLAFEEQYVQSKYHNNEKNIHKQILPGQFVFIENYNTNYDIGYKFSMEHFVDGKLASKLMSDYIQWDTTMNKWKITNAIVRDFEEDKEVVTFTRKLDTTINLLPKDFTRRENVVEAMNWRQLDEFIAQEEMVGSENVILWRIEKHKRFAFPFSTFILTVIGVSLSSRKRRGGIGINIGLGILLAFTYILFMQVSTVMATNASVSPIFAVWVPNILYSIIAFLLYIKAAR